LDRLCTRWDPVHITQMSDLLNIFRWPDGTRPRLGENGAFAAGPGRL
jgi:hypothetical protein